MKILERKRYGWTGPPFFPPDRKSDKVFQMVIGNIVSGNNVVHLNIPLRATEAHTAPWIKNTLLSVNRLAAEKCISVFSGDKPLVYDATNTKLTVSRQAVLEGWHSEHKGIWRIAIVERSDYNNTETVLVNRSLLELLGDSAQLPTKRILSVYKLKAQPELICYYHAAAGFPTQPTWIAAIKNRHYIT